MSGHFECYSDIESNFQVSTSDYCHFQREVSEFASIEWSVRTAYEESLESQLSTLELSVPDHV